MSGPLNAPAGPVGRAPLLKMQGISKHFGGLQALKDVDLTLHAGEPRVTAAIIP